MVGPRRSEPSNMLQPGPTWLLAAVFLLADVLPIPSCDCSSSDESVRKVRGKATITKIEPGPRSVEPSCVDPVVVYFDFLENERTDSPHNATHQELVGRNRTFPRAFIERKGIWVGRAYACTKRIYPTRSPEYALSNLDLSDDDGDCP